MSRRTNFSTPTIHDLRKELTELDKKKLVDLCLRLGRSRVENKEFLAYLIFYAADEEAYVEQVKAEMDLQLKEMNTSNFYLAKKTIRKVLRTANKHIKFSDSKDTELQLRIHFCKRIKQSKVSISKHQVLFNLYNNQLKKIESVLKKIHEDLQYDYRKEIDSLHLN